MADLGVVMPLYKQDPHFLKAAIDSIQSQQFQDFVVLIVIDGAPEMEPMVKTFIQNDSRFFILSQPKDQGVAKSLNIGFKEFFKHEQIQYLTWVSSDNIYYPSFLGTLREKLLKGPDELGLVYSSFQSINNEGKPLYDEFQLAVQRKYQSQPKDKLLDSSIIGVSFMYKSKYAKMIDGYLTVPIADYEYFLRITEHCEIRFLPVELMDYRVNSTFSVSSSLQTVEKHRNWRYTYHLARHQARIRRGIPHLLTVLYPLNKADSTATERIENLYEQTFSNYVCYVLDLSHDQQVSNVLSAISHPLTNFKWLPNVNEVNALFYIVQMVQTPFVMIINSKLYPVDTDLDILTNGLLKADSLVCSNCYTESHKEVGYRYPDSPFTIRHMYNELFRTEQLIKLLKQHIHD
ncbi:glycosyltransferase [Paenibacillus terrae HPL-003]|uniref:Glycosyltransferase n=1 Tax=Paenibacillus terrae (strain HPL-003) TaxID=985665 RepID=G7VQ56_PAETH|nr:glycosyltransferase family 2 protein [Paenibacillus terrae]AET61125.1 glycosyltransferase [Paenibacillus terrae HPL-003]